jgi:hypothetical protein
MLALPLPAHLFLGRVQVVGRSRERRGALDLREHDGPDTVGNSALPVEREGLVEQASLSEDRPRALETVSLARAALRLFSSQTSLRMRASRWMRGPPREQSACLHTSPFSLAELALGDLSDIASIQATNGTLY